MALLSRRRTRWVALGVCVLAVLGIFFYLMNRERLYDPNFDTSISDPAYKTERPRVLYDEGHRNTHTADAAYKPFADLIRNDGYAVQVLREPVTQDRLTGTSVFVIVCAQEATIRMMPPPLRRRRPQRSISGCGLAARCSS